jgi:hypothetical protein
VSAAQYKVGDPVVTVKDIITDRGWLPSGTRATVSKEGRKVVGIRFGKSVAYVLAREIEKVDGGQK